MGFGGAFGERHLGWHACCDFGLKNIETDGKSGGNVCEPFGGGSEDS